MILKNWPEIKSFIKSNKFLYYLLLPVILARRIVIQNKYRHFDKFYDSLRGLVDSGSLIVSVPDFEGVFEISFHSDILKVILRDMHYETKIVEVAKRHIDPQRDVIDIGANIGLFTNLFSKLISGNNRILAIEPAPSAIGYLRRNLERNDCTKSVIIYEGAAIGRESLVKLNIVPGMEEYSSLGKIMHSAVKNKSSISIEVNGSTLDNLVDEFNLKPGFIKIDTEGAEYSVISGATKTLAKNKPVILSELSDTYLSSHGDTSKKVVDLLQSLGYQVLDAMEPSISITYPFHGEILAIPLDRQGI